MNDTTMQNIHTAIVKKTVTEIYSDQFRVTSVPFKNSHYIIFSGVPIKKDSYKINSGKYYISIKILQEVLPVLPAVGQHWSVQGERRIESVEVGDYMMQQHVYESPSYLQCSLPEDGESLIKFIAYEKDFKGIGESKARALWELLGKDFHATLRADIPESRGKLKLVLSDSSIDGLYEGYAKYKNLAACGWMSDHKIPASIQQRLLKFHNEKSVDAIKENPFLLIGFGMLFEDIDKLVDLNLFEIAKCDNKRLSAAVEMAIRKEIEKGHTYTTQHDIKPRVKGFLGDNELVSQAFKAGYDKAQFVMNHETGTYHPTAQLLMESVVAKRLTRFVASNNLYDEKANNAYGIAVGELPYELTAMQSEAVIVTLDNSVSCITGGAGTGKTTVLRTALRAYHEMGFEIYAIALSGRAAMRLHESIGFKTMTIAAFLRQEPIEPITDRKKHLLVIDEGSMIDLPIMYRIVNHIHPSVRIVITGDPDQLPPIGCGKVLSDIVESGVIANTRLDIVKRQEGSTGIPEYSKLINEGVVPDNLSVGAVHFHETEKQNIAQVCTDLYIKSPRNSRIMGSTQAMVAEINKLTQNQTNPFGDRLEFEMHGEKLFRDIRVGDSILFTQNNYDKGIQNGSLGVLISTELVGESYGIVELDTDEKIEITQPVLDCMQLGYCITLHKAQGSQFPRVIIGLQEGRIVDRAWLYTAITRAESEIHIVGSSNAFARVTQEPSHSHKRNSFLSSLLKTQNNLYLEERM
jgi:exodeoxyribonuclease V alpha subunit